MKNTDIKDRKVIRIYECAKGVAIALQGKQKLIGQPLGTVRSQWGPLSVVLVDHDEYNAIREVKGITNFQPAIDRSSTREEELPRPDFKALQLWRIFSEVASLPAPAEGEECTTIEFEGYKFARHPKTAKRLRNTLEKQFNFTEADRLRASVLAIQPIDTLTVENCATDEQQTTTLTPKAEEIEKYLGCGCTYGRIGKTKYVQRVTVQSPWGEIRFAYHGTKKGAFNVVKKEFGGYTIDICKNNHLCLRYSNDTTLPEVHASCEQFPIDLMTRAVVAWSVKEFFFPQLPTALPAAGTPDPVSAAVETPTAKVMTANGESATPSNQKTATPPVKKFSWADMSEEERHPQPEFFEGLKRLADKEKISHFKVFQMAAAAVDQCLAEDPTYWRNLPAGSFVNLCNCAKKMDGANNLGGIIENFVDCSSDGSPLYNCLAMIEKIIECTDEDIQLFGYSHTLPEGCAMGGAWGNMEESYTLVTMMKSSNYCVFIDAEGYTWSRYVLLLHSWRSMFAGDVTKIEEETKQHEMAEAAQQVVEKAQRLLSYRSDCDKLQPYMVADLTGCDKSSTARKRGRVRNIKSALKHFFPGISFKVSSEGSWRTNIHVAWTDGPTKKDVENCCNWSVFCDTWTSFNGYDDSTNSGTREFTDFANKYGGGDEIVFDRYFSPEREENAINQMRRIFNDLNLGPASYNRDRDAEIIFKIQSAVRKAYSDSAAGYCFKSRFWFSASSVAHDLIAINADIQGAA